MTKSDREKIVVIGLGYIGLPTASLLATKGFPVLGVDVKPQVIETINAGNIHIVEPDLDILVRSAVNSGLFKASLTPEEGDVFILAVPTPFQPQSPGESGGMPRPDLSHVEAATLAIAPHLRPGNLVILESTSPVGTTERVDELLAEHCPQLKGKIFIAHCPERVLPGAIIRELVDNDRIIGGINAESAQQAKDLYQTFCNGQIYLTDCRSAEAVKLVENSYRDVNIAFANELSLICDRLDISVWQVIEMANRHPRVNILKPGPGVGGHCIAVDPWFLAAAAPDLAKLISTARGVNDNKPAWILEKIRSKASRFREPVIGCLGLTYKADIDDLRESPALAIVRSLIEEKVGTVMACEPNCNGEFEEFPLHPLEDVLSQADILVLLVDHDQFRKIDPNRLREIVLIDTRGVWI
jgi:UDP-N-acetyl-D-mannosaminuronic acid dehydrogenase